MLFLALLLVATGCKVSEVKPVGSWRPVQQGQFESVQWKLFATDPIDEGTCIAFETSGGVEPSPDLPAEDLYQGKTPACLTRPSEGTSSRYLNAIKSMDYGSMEAGQRNYGFLIGLVEPEVDTITVELDKDGGSHVVDTSEGFVAFVYDASFSPQHIKVDAGGTTVECDLDRKAAVGEVSC